MDDRTFHSAEAGIAIGPILFVIALLAILAAVMAAGFGDFGTAGISDRVTADIVSQANLIRTKINECNVMYGTNQNYDGYPSSDPSNGTLVSALDCTGDTAQSLPANLWSGARTAMLPQPTTGFSNWNYINTDNCTLSGYSCLGGSTAGGRCIWIVPTVSNPSQSAGLVQGLTKAAGKFTNQTSCNNSGTPCTSEVIYDPSSSSQKFVLWISLPTGTPDSHCLP
jgi:hypothetical protein